MPGGGEVDQEAGDGPVVRRELCEAPLSPGRVLLQIVTGQEERERTPLHRQLITFGTLHPSDSSSSSPNFYH